MKSQKDKFQLKKGISYINCAYMSPLLISADKKGIEGMKRKRNPFEISQDDFFKDAQVVKNLFATIVNCSMQNVAIFPSVSYGFSSITANISAKNKKNVIVVANEFPSAYFAAKTWCEKNKCELKVISNIDNQENNEQRTEIWNEDILNTIDENTAFILISSIHWMDGTKFNLEKIGKKCKQVGAKFLVDGTQSVGALKMDVAKFNIDFLVCASYKWLFGPYSSSIAYISSVFENGKPLEESWMNRKNAKDFSNLTNYNDNYFEGAGRFNVGETNDFIKMPMLIESFKQIIEWNPNQIQKYCKKLTQPLNAFFKEIDIHISDEKFQAQHLIGFKLEQKFNVLKLQEDLIKNKIYLSLRGDFLRISPNIYNTQKDIKKLISVLKDNFLK